MRRTRFVVLPVRSWHYVGLMVVSLACLTLGLVSRDREGKSGNLTGPELKHTAPHEVDACPNDFPYAVRTRTADDLASRRINPEKGILERRVKESSTIRDTLKNKRLNRMHISRSITLEDMRTRNYERRTASLDRRHLDISRLRDAQNIGRLNNDRLSSEIKSRRHRLLERVSMTLRQDGINEERIAKEDSLLRSRSERRSSMSERRDRTGVLDRQDRRARIDATRRKIIQSEERRSLDRQMERRERIHHDMRDNRRTNNRHLERHERASSERRDGRAIIETSERTRINVVDVDSSRRNMRIRMNPVIELDRRQMSRERRVSMMDRRLDDERSGTRRYNSRYTDGYLMPETQFPFVKSTFGNGSYEFLRQTFILALCTFYTASLFKRKGTNILPGINQLQVW